MAESINNEDSFNRNASHTCAKRQLLKEIINSVAERRFSKAPKAYQPSITYIDAFAGKGYFGDRVLPTPNDDICKWGTPLIALDVFMECIDKKLSERCERACVGKSVVHEFSCFFIFNDLHHKDDLMKFVEEYLEKKNNGYEIHQKQDKIVLCKTYSNSICSINVTIFIEFYRLKFKNMAARFQRIVGPVFSLLDPTGRITLPRDVIKLLMGKERDLLINFNVQYANRAGFDLVESMKKFSLSDEKYATITHERAPHNPKLPLDRNINEDVKNLSLSDNIDEKFDTITHEYMCSIKDLREESTRTTIYTSTFTLKKGERRPDNASFFYLVFGTCSPSVLQDAKMAFQSVNQKDRECVNRKDRESSFTDYFNLNGILIEPGRKTTKKDEADKIYEKFCRKGSVKLGELKRMILEETPFPYHALVLRLLENDKRIQMYPRNKDGTQDTRRNNELCYAVSRNPDDPDTEKKKYGNFWEIKFRKPE